MTSAAETLVEVSWLRDLLDQPDLLVVDTRISDDYGRSHLPGAISWDTYLKYHWADTSPAGMEQFNRLLAFTVGQHGISRHHQIVFYDEGGVGYRAIRGVWVLSYLGHQRAHLLNGGLAAWQAAGLPLSHEPRRPQPVQFEANIQPRLVATYRDVLEAIGQPDKAILDARAPDEHRGENMRAIRGGTIPGAVNVDYVNNVDEQGRFKSPQVLRRLYESAGLRPEQEIMTYCQGNYRAAHAWLALRLAGYDRVRPYLGSWQEWGDRIDLPIETPPG